MPSKKEWRGAWDSLSSRKRKKKIQELEALPLFNYETFVKESGIDYRSESIYKTKQVDTEGLKMCLRGAIGFLIIPAIYLILCMFYPSIFNVSALIFSGCPSACLALIFADV